MEDMEEMVLQQLVMEEMAVTVETALMAEMEVMGGTVGLVLLTVATEGTVAMVDRNEKKHFF
jgi:hypothetical protein